MTTLNPFRGSSSLLAALLLAAAPAAAQRTAAIAAEAAPRATVSFAAAPTAAAGGQGISLGLSPSLLAALTPTASPSPRIAAARPSAAGALPLLAPNAAILAASRPASAAPILAAAAATLGAPALKVIAAKSVSRGAAARPDAAKHSVSAAAPAAAETLSGGELFDGSSRIPTVAAALARGRAQGVSMGDVARAIAGSRDMPEAGGRLTGLGLLELSEVRSDHPDTLTHLETLVEGLWRETSPALGLDSGVDRRWAVPALVVNRGLTTFYVHPIAHGQIRPDNRGPVLRLIKEIKASGGLLYSEQNLPAAYGYREGLEFLDHAAATGESVSVKGAAAGPALDRALTSLLPLGALAWSAFHVWSAPSHPEAWALFAAALALSWLLSRAFKPLFRWRRLLKAAQLRAAGDIDGAAWFAADAAAFYGRLIDPAALLRLRLPLPLGLGSDAYSKRSLGMADALAPDAAARGAGEVHVLTGYEHSLEIAWRLENPGESKA